MEGECKVVEGGWKVVEVGWTVVEGVQKEVADGLKVVEER